MRRNLKLSKEVLLVFATLLLVFSPFTFANAAPEGRPAGAPEEIKIAWVDFYSGPGATMGIPEKQAVEWLVNKYNSEGGIRGVKIKLALVDEMGGPDKQVMEYRRMVLDEKIDVVCGYTSSASCLAIAPVAEELQTLTLIQNCGSHRITEDLDLKYTFRTANTQVSECVMAARYILETMPDVKTIAGMNEDFSWGRDNWEAFKTAIQTLKPDVKVVTELWTKFQAGEYSAEISKLLAVKPDVIYSSLWGGGQVAFVKQAVPRGLFRRSLVFFNTAENPLQEYKKQMPDNVLVCGRATVGYFLYPAPDTNPRQKEFVEGIKSTYGRYPDFTCYRAYQTLAGLKAAYEKAIDQVGKWPSTEEVIQVFENLQWNTVNGPIQMRPDHQVVHSGMIGMTKYSPEYGFPIMDRTKLFPADEIMPPYGMKTLDWLKTLK